MSDSTEFDLLVLGGGMAGMSAAAEAALRGARVMVCEAADHLGGTALLSTGNIWTVQTPEAFREADPGGDVALWQVVRDELEESLAWVEAMDVPVRDRHKASSSSTYDPPPIGRNVDIETFLLRARRAVESADGVVLHGTTISALDVDDRRVVGGRITTLATGDEHDLHARGVVLASGGFQASRDLRAKYLGEVVADSVAIRSNPYSTGAGIELGLSAGAALSQRSDTFYGVILPAIPGEITEGDYRGLVLHAAVYGVVVAPDGTRLVDESAGAVPLANAVARAGRALFVVSPAMAMAADDRLGIDLGQMLSAARERGARVAAVTDLQSSAQVIGPWGYDVDVTSGTLQDYQRSITSGDVLEPPRRRHRLGLDDGELFMVEVQAAMTSTYGGVRTNLHGQTLAEDGSVVEGLYAAGVDQGGFNVTGYSGGLSRALVYGRRAASNALGNQ